MSSAYLQNTVLSVSAVNTRSDLRRRPTTRSCELIKLSLFTALEDRHSGEIYFVLRLIGVLCLQMQSYIMLLYNSLLLDYVFNLVANIVCMRNSFPVEFIV